MGFKIYQALKRYDSTFFNSGQSLPFPDKSYLYINNWSSGCQNTVVQPLDASDLHVLYFCNVGADIPVCTRGGN